jgi:hypothetical protein
MGVLEGVVGFDGGFGGWSDRTSSTPAVVPGAAPALAKAGVGGFLDFKLRSVSDATNKTAGGLLQESLQSSY